MFQPISIWLFPLLLLAGGYAVWCARKAHRARTEAAALHARIDALSSEIATCRRLLKQDDLTGLSTRSHFMHTLADGRRVGDYALCLVDVDSFKSINDTYGHATGDSLLIAIAQDLRNGAGPDALVARLGGDEFAVALPVDGAGDGSRRLEAMRRAAHEREVAGEWKGLRRSVSIGVTLLSPTDRLSAAMAEADTALYAAKEGGRNRIVRLDEHLRLRHREAMSEPTLEQMRAGVENSEFTYFVQPIYNLQTGRPVGVEALIRWVTSDGRVRLPGEFMHLFTRQYNGTLKPPLDAANAVAASFAAPGSDLFCAFNISTAFLKRSFDPSDVWLEDLLMGIEPSRVVFEITETAAIDNTTAARQMLGFLRDRGVRIALDDFGTGYSNLERLVDLPIDIVKVDRVFVSRLPGNRRNRAIVGGLLSLGHELGFEVIAEGVETQEQLEALHDLGVSMAQGFHLARPQTLEDWARTQGAAHPGVSALRRVAGG